MNDITNRTIFTTMIIIGVITIGLLLAQRQQAVSYSYPVTSNNLGASAYDANSYSGNNLNLSLPRAGYVPVVYTNYPVSAYRFNNTRTTTSYSTAPSTRTKTYYTTSYLPDETGYNGSYNSSDYQGYVPAGCESGTDYSLTTGEPCG